MTEKEATERLQSLANKVAQKVRDIQQFQELSTSGLVLHGLVNPENKERAITEARAVRDMIYSFALVFMHSLLEEVVDELLSYSCAVDPDSWTEHIQERSVKLVNMKGRSYDECRQELLIGFLEKLSRSKPLATRIGILLSKCEFTPEKEAEAKKLLGSVVDGYRYDQKRIESIDENRQKIVHQMSFVQRNKESESDLLYLGLTMIFFTKLVAQSYDL